ncbi:chitin synthase [Malassezia vespertilionis]|uniref:Chitin synthase n=3 Tax=Malassezia vespertilionis TaxID=2020962 RepID=A0A2N1J9L9_9BASI|nr:chitin synthase [Malassezia vespertilionis]PKI83244.1 Chs1p [Malassezia vespertilionis]WFD07616.1 chitin synthase [Malassezia vespertilionis]
MPGASNTWGNCATPVVQYESRVDAQEFANPYDLAPGGPPLPTYDEANASTEIAPHQDSPTLSEYDVYAIPGLYAQSAMGHGDASEAHTQPLQPAPEPVPWINDGQMPYMVPYSDNSKEVVSSGHSDDMDSHYILQGLVNGYDSTIDHAASDEDVPIRADDEESRFLEEDLSEHYGRIPERQPRRHRTLRRVPLRDGHLVLDCPVPPKLLEKQAIQEGSEFTHMRYSAVTCDADDFEKDGYMLRPALYNTPRETELCIVLTMYNEDEKLFARTMHGVMQNIAYMCSLKKSAMWGEDGWKRVVVCIVADGCNHVSSRTLSVLAAMGVYQEGVRQTEVQGKPVQAHIYEYTAQVSVTRNMKMLSKERGLVPVQILFCMKENNQKKINSHRWCFNAFGPVLQPKVYVLLDVGTKPCSRSIYRLWEAFDRDANVGGACGEIVALKGKLWHGLVNPLVAAQNFEYKLSNVLDKPMESAFGYITVLPGAFSAYRYEALKNDVMGHGPLATYFEGEKLHGGAGNADIFTSNMYLAEDRILCWELVTKRNCAWILRYVSSAQAETDVPHEIPELIAQRRRWLNGSFFAAIHSAIKFTYIYRSTHSTVRKVFLHIELIYLAIQLLYNWFILANYFIAFSILTDSLAHVVHWVHVPAVICSYIYIAFVIFCYLLSMGNRPAGNKLGYLLSIIVFGLLMLFMMVSVIYLSVTSVMDAVRETQPNAIMSNPTVVRVFISVLSTYGIWLIASLLFLQPWHMFTSILQYLLLSPSFVNVFNVYAFCNTHDVSWGTKGSDTNKVPHADLFVPGNVVEVAMPSEPTDLNAAYEDACHILANKPVRTRPGKNMEQYQTDYYAAVRTNVVLAWTLTNAALAIAILNLPYHVHTVYLAFLFYSVAALSFFRLLGVIAYLVAKLFPSKQVPQV